MKIIAMLVFLAALLAVDEAAAQQSTEIYIPIGETPGLGADSYIGAILSVDYDTKRLEIDTPDGRRNVTVDENTDYYLDRTAYGKQNTTGSIQDCRVGRRIEAYVDEDGTAHWVKVQTD